LTLKEQNEIKSPDETEKKIVDTDEEDKISENSNNPQNEINSHEKADKNIATYEEEKICLNDIEQKKKNSCFEYFGYLDNFLFKNEVKKEKNLLEKKEITNSCEKQENLNSSEKKENVISSESKKENINSFQLKEIINSFEQKGSINDCELKENINKEEMVNSLNTAEKKKRRMTNSSEEQEEIFKNIYLKKKRFKFESPLLKSNSHSSGKINPSPIEITSNDFIKENSNEDTVDPQAEKEIFKKFHRLRKIKEIKDENTCPICLGNSFII